MNNRDWFSMSCMVLMAPHIDKPMAVVMAVVFLAISLIFKD